MFITNHGDRLINEQMTTPTPYYDLKRQICVQFNLYYLLPKFKFFIFGPQHCARAESVLNAITKCADLETIKDILDHQIKIMEGENFIATKSEVEMFTALGIDKRYVLDNGLKNKSKDLSASGYYKALTKCRELVKKDLAAEQGHQPQAMVMK